MGGGQWLPEWDRVARDRLTEWILELKLGGRGGAREAGCTEDRGAGAGGEEKESRRRGQHGESAVETGGGQEMSTETPGHPAPCRPGLRVWL